MLPGRPAAGGLSLVLFFAPLIGLGLAVVYFEAAIGPLAGIGVALTVSDIATAFGTRETTIRPDVGSERAAGELAHKTIRQFSGSHQRGMAHSDRGDGATRHPRGKP